MWTCTLKLASATTAVAVLALAIGAACGGSNAPGKPTALPPSAVVTQALATPAYTPEASATPAVTTFDLTRVPPQELEQAVRSCLATASPEAISQTAQGIEDCVLGIGLRAQAVGVEGSLPVLLVDVANPECMFDEFIAWWGSGQWQLQYMNPLFPAGSDYRIATRTLAGAEMPFPREVSVPQGIRLGIINSFWNCGSAPGASFLLLAFDENSWRVLWDAQDTEIADLAHTQVRFLGEGIGNIVVMGDSLHLPDTKSRIFHESNVGPHRHFQQTWTLEGDEYVLRDRQVEPSAYNTLVEFIYCLSTGDESSAEALLADPALLDTAKALGLVQNPLGQEWLTDLERNTECCGPIRILEGLPQRVVVSFAQRGEDWLISDIKPE
jgi:hypothetical protein